MQHDVKYMHRTGGLNAQMHICKYIYIYTYQQICINAKMHMQTYVNPMQTYVKHMSTYANICKTMGGLGMNFRYGPSPCRHRQRRRRPRLARSAGAAASPVASSAPVSSSARSLHRPLQQPPQEAASSCPPSGCRSMCLDEALIEPKWLRQDC